MVKAKWVSAGNKVLIDGRNYPVQRPGKGQNWNMAAIKADNFEVDVSLVPSDTNPRSKTMVAKLDRKFLKKISRS